MSPFENSTQAIGAIAFGITAITCLLSGKARTWHALSCVHLIFAAEIAVGLRHRLHIGIDYLLQLAGYYASRTAFQIMLLTAVALCVILLAASRIHKMLAQQLYQAESIACAATAVTGCVFALEIISLHAVDSYLYAQVGGVMRIGWLWLSGATIVTASALYFRHQNARIRNA